MPRPYPPISPRCRRICVGPKRAHFSGRTSTGGRHSRPATACSRSAPFTATPSRALLEGVSDPAEAARIHREAWAFFAETVAPVEMCLRGYQQSNDSLRALAATLDEQVRERTRDLDESLEELRRADQARRLLLERLMSAQEDERRRIAGDIHDDSIQVITAAYLRVELIRQALGDDPHAETLEKLDEALRASIDRLRHMIFELRPAMLDTAGLAATIHEHLDQWTRQTGSTYTLANRLSAEPEPLARTTLYRIAAEALANVRKHARARHVSVDLAHEASGYLLRVADDGVGLGGGRGIGPERALRRLDDDRAGVDGRRMVPRGEQRAGARHHRRRMDARQPRRAGDRGRRRSSRPRARSTRCRRFAS